MHTFELWNAESKLTLFNYGARIIDWQVKLGNEWRPIVLRYKSLDDYVDDPFYLGAVCGPFANRIANGCINAESNRFELSCNDGVNHLHGGFSGLDKQTWRLRARTENSVTFECQHADGQDGYPGPMSFEAIYTLEGKCLTLSLSCQSETFSVIGPTGHAYFNLNGADSLVSGLEQYLQSDAELLTPFNAQGLPIGNEQRTHGSGLNFDQARLLSSAPHLKKLDNNFVFEEGKNKSKLEDFNKQLSLSVTSDYPAVQLYSGSFLNKPFSANQGICVEPHFGADSPNRVNNFDWLIKPGQIWQKTIEYQLSVI